MKKGQRKLQIILVMMGFFLFSLTYLYYPNLKKKEKILTKSTIIETVEESERTVFKNMEYKGLYDFNKPFKVLSEEAYMLDDDPDYIYMENMRVIINLGENRKIEITSLRGRYNKVNYNCYFEEKVFATDGSIKITANNLDLLADKNYMEIYNDVSLYHITGSLKADKIDYNFETKNFKVSMFDDKQIKMKVIQ
jgi:lipopolysaccharide assembly outer membrane protein LptD (OstA)